LEGDLERAVVAVRSRLLEPVWVLASAAQPVRPTCRVAGRAVVCCFFFVVVVFPVVEVALAQDDRRSVVDYRPKPSSECGPPAALPAPTVAEEAVTSEVYRSALELVP
jgi:hypothetical protein